MKPKIDPVTARANFRRLQGENDSRTSRLNLLAIIFGCTIAIIYLSSKYIGQKTDFEDAATFGADTISAQATVDGYRINCSDSRDADDCIAGAKSRHAANTVLWLGNSQVGSVNQLKKGETNAPPLLFNNLKTSDLDLVTFNQPNANMQEHYVLFEYLRQQLPVKILILPAVFDDTREDGLRREVSDFLADAATASALFDSAIGKKILKINAVSAPNKGGDTAGILHTLQERVERVLNTWLDETSALWLARPEIRGQIMNYLYVWRNTVFGIKPTTKRKIIRGRYQDNFDSLEAILAAAAHQGISVVLYIVPLRNDVEIPYVKSEYQQYKKEVQALAERYKAKFSNLEDLVPAALWGSKASTSVGMTQELDFMHFQADGHKLLAHRLAKLVTSARAEQVSKQ